MLHIFAFKSLARCWLWLSSFYIRNWSSERAYGCPQIITCQSQDCSRSSSLMPFLNTAASVRQLAGWCAVFDLDFNRFLCAETPGPYFLSEHCGAVWPGLLQSTLCPSDVLSTVDLIMSLLLKASSAFPHLRTHVFGGLLKLDTFISYPGLLCVSSAFWNTPTLLFTCLFQLSAQMFRESFSNSQTSSSSSVSPVPAVFSSKAFR